MKTRTFQFTVTVKTHGTRANDQRETQSAAIDDTP